MEIDTGIKFFGLIVAFATAYYARLSWKRKNIEAKQTRPKIVHLNGFGKYLHLTISNNKPHPISIHKITAKERFLGPLFFRSTPIAWKPIEEYTPVRNAQEALARFCKMPEYSISKQQTLLIEFLEHVPGLVYKLHLATTGGKCQSIYRSSLEHSVAKFEAEVGKE
jgi:hypothetical protein